MLEAHLTRFEAKVGELSRLLHVRDEQISKIYKRVGELSDEFAENGEDVSSLDSSVKVLKMKVEDLDKSTEDGFANMKIILEQIRDWIGTYKQPLDWVKSEHDKIHPVNENEKKSK
jgi:t-SNARE complex subunit (syntaxin)